MFTTVIGAVVTCSTLHADPRLAVINDSAEYTNVERGSKETIMSTSKFLTPDEVAVRYRGGISIGTLRNWRAMRIGPTFVKIGKAVLYPVDDLDAWDEKNKVQCRASRGLTEADSDQSC